MGLKGAIVDLDGTIYRGKETIPGARDGIATLRAAGLDLLFCSNNPTRAGQRYVSILDHHDIDAEPTDVLTAGDVTTAYLAAEHAEDAITVVGSDGFRSQLKDADLELTNDPSETDVFVGSWTREFDYGDMELALQAIDDETVFLGTDPDRTVPGPDGEIPGSGAVLRALAGATGRDPDRILGKPSAVARATALDRLGIAPEECLVIGDRPDTDLALGADVGMTTALVLSGVTTPDAVGNASVEPTHVLDSLGDVGRILD